MLPLHLLVQQNRLSKDKAWLDANHLLPNGSALKSLNRIPIIESKISGAVLFNNNNNNNNNNKNNNNNNNNRKYFCNSQSEIAVSQLRGIDLLYHAIALSSLQMLYIKHFNYLHIKKQICAPYSHCVIE